MLRSDGILDVRAWGNRKVTLRIGRRFQRVARINGRAALGIVRSIKRRALIPSGPGGGAKGPGRKWWEMLPHPACPPRDLSWWEGSSTCRLLTHAGGHPSRSGPLVLGGLSSTIGNGCSHESPHSCLPIPKSTHASISASTKVQKRRLSLEGLAETQDPRQC